MRNKTISFTLFALLLTGSCKMPYQASDVNTFPGKPVYSIQAGINKGGIVENTDIENEPGTGVDAFSGATKTGFNVGGRVVLPLKRNAIESGLDFMQNRQTFSYDDAVNDYLGKRDITISQFVIPLTWNLGIINQRGQGNRLEIKLGPAFQLNLMDTRENGTNLPVFSYNRWSAGLSAGISATPVIFEDGSKLGLFVESYRGSQIYEDFYNQNDFEIPGSSYSKFGIVFHFK